MFNLQGSEIVIILLLALVVLGPEKLPDAMRKAGKFYAELKKMSSGFQDEFRAAVEEPMREVRETANVLRDSADFTKLQSGDREEKPKSAEMAAVDPAKHAVPSDDIPTFETPDADPAPELTDDSKPAPFVSVITRGGRPVERPVATPAEPAVVEHQAPSDDSGAAGSGTDGSGTDGSGTDESGMDGSGTDESGTDESGAAAVISDDDHA